MPPKRRAPAMRTTAKRTIRKVRTVRDTTIRAGGGDGLIRPATDDPSEMLNGPLADGVIEEEEDDSPGNGNS